MLQSNLLLSYKNLRHYFLEKNDVSDGNNTASLKTIIEAEQIHSDRVRHVANFKNKLYKGCDGLMTNKKVYLSIRTADCLPIFFYDTRNNFIAAIHAGWRGLYLGIVEKTINLMKSRGSEAPNIIVAAGPHIRVCCYKVPRHRFFKFQNLLSIQHTQSFTFWYLDLEKIVQLQLLKLGVELQNIDILPYCTCCDERFWSYRRDKTNMRMKNIIGIVS